MNLEQNEMFDRQFAALRMGCGVVPLADWSSVALTGADRQAFLHSFCTNDVKRLTPGTSSEAFFTNVKGKVIGHGLVTCRDDMLTIIGPPAQGPTLAAHLERYVIREDVTVRDSTADRSYLLLTFGKEAQGESWVKGLANGAAKPDDISANWFRWDLLGGILCGLWESTPAEAPHVQQVLIEHGALPCAESVFHALRIEAGTPLFGVDFDDGNFPQEVCRNQQAISFTKGCYLGQETVARIDAMGHVNQQIVGVKFSSTEIPEAGLELTLDGKTVGHVTSAAFSPQLQSPLALAMLRREHTSPGSKLDSPVGTCEVVALPVV